MAFGDLVQHAGDDGQRRVPGQLNDPQVESRGAESEIVGGVRGRDILIDDAFEFVEMLIGALGGQNARGFGFDRLAGHEHVRDCDSGELEEQRRWSCDDFGAGDADSGAGTGSASHLYEAFGFQDTYRLAQSGAADREVLHQFGLVREVVAVLEIAVDDHATKVACDQLGGLGCPDRAGCRTV